MKVCTFDSKVITTASMACSISALEEGIRNAETEKVQLLQEISEQVKFSMSSLECSRVYNTMCI